jgi:heptosyltransferase-2
MAILIKATGFFLSLLPYKTLEYLTECLGGLFISFPSARRRILFSNLHYAFPHRSYDEIKRIAQESAARMFEMGFFSLCYPFLSRDKLRRSMVYSNDAEKKIRELRVGSKPVILMLPHLSLFETVATSPHFRPQGGRRLGAIYRPNKNKALDRWINSARLKVGIDMFSREDGFSQTREFLKKGNWLIILFDQNAGNQGTLSLFLDRLASITTLPDLLQKATKARAVYISPKRLSFFRSKIELTELKGARSIAFDSHDILADQITNHPNGFPDWLWSHSKWKTQYYPQVKFGLRLKRIALPSTLPRKLVFVIRMPNWLGDIMMAIPILLAISKSRPDVKFILLCKPQYKSLLQYLRVGDVLFSSGNIFSPISLKVAFSIRKLFPDCHFLFTNSFHGDFEAFLVGSAHRFGLRRPGKPRPLLSHLFRPDRHIIQGGAGVHQSELWTMLGTHFGLDGPIDYSPLIKTINPPSLKIGIILGSENHPAKRWATDKWSELCKLLLESNKSVRIFLYGTNKEVGDAYDITHELHRDRVCDLTGKTSLPELADEFASCEIVVGCDSGGVHLANSLGTKVVVLFGPTNPQMTKPCYDSPLIVIQPKDSPIEGGCDMSLITPSEVFEKCNSFCNTPS